MIERPLLRIRASFHKIRVKLNLRHKWTNEQTDKHINKQTITNKQKDKRTEFDALHISYKM